MKIIDIHANVGIDLNNLRKNQIPVEQNFKQLLIKMDEYDISVSVIVPFPSPGGQFNSDISWYDAENHILINASYQSKRLIPFPAVNPNDNESVESIEENLLVQGIKGIKISHEIPMGFSIEELIGHKLMDIVQKNNLILMLHTGTGKELGAGLVHNTLDYAIKVAKAYPKVKFIFCHLGRLHQSIEEAFNLKNVYMDTAGLALHTHWNQFIAKDALNIFRKSNPIQVIEELVRAGYEDKILFGSDEPYTSYERQLEHINKSGISDEAKNKILYENAAKLLRINLRW
jgi:predicted TIM-barrel fold metal-dependent hydrolase